MEKWWGLYNKQLNAKSPLSERAQASFLEEGYKAAQAHYDAAQPLIQMQRERAGRLGLDPQERRATAVGAAATGRRSGRGSGSRCWWRCWHARDARRQALHKSILTARTADHTDASMSCTDPDLLKRLEAASQAPAAAPAAAAPGVIDPGDSSSG